MRIQVFQIRLWLVCDYNFTNNERTGDMPLWTEILKAVTVWICSNMVQIIFYGGEESFDSFFLDPCFNSIFIFHFKSMWSITVLQPYTVESKSYQRSLKAMKIAVSFHQFSKLSGLEIFLNFEWYNTWPKIPKNQISPFLFWTFLLNPHESPWDLYIHQSFLISHLSEDKKNVVYRLYR